MKRASEGMGPVGETGGSAVMTGVTWPDPTEPSLLVVDVVGDLVPLTVVQLPGVGLTFGPVALLPLAWDLLNTLVRGCPKTPSGSACMCV